MKGKIQYHGRSKHASIDKSNPNILTNSPAIDVSKNSRLKIPESIFFDKNIQLVKKYYHDPNLYIYIYIFIYILLHFFIGR